MVTARMQSNTPLDWTGHQLPSAAPPQAPCLPLRGSVGPSRCAADSTARIYYQAFNISSFIVIIARQSALHVCRLIISYTLWKAMKAMEQAFLPIIEANRKGNLKWCRIYLLQIEAPPPSESQCCGACSTPDRSWLRTIYPCR